MSRCLCCGLEITTGGCGCANFPPFLSVVPMPQYGWICPKCGRVYAPSNIACLSCNIDPKPPIQGGQERVDIPK